MEYMGIVEEWSRSLPSENTRKHTYRIDDKNYSLFKSWCSRRGVDTSSAIRGAIGLLMEQGNLQGLLESDEMKKLAVELLSKQFERSE